jgi:HK97 family phage prohead protease
MIKQMEHKNFILEVKEIDEQGIIRGYLSTFNNVDYQKDRVLPGAFRKTIADALQRKTNKSKTYLWPLLWMHDAEKPIGGFLDAVEDAKGLYVTAQVDISTNEQGYPRNPLAMSVYSGLKEGYIDELSIGYKAIQKDYTQDGIRDLKEVQVWEGSAVTSLFAANNEALIETVKSSTQAAERKDFNERYAQECLSDWINGDFYNLTCALKASLLDIFSIGDEPNADVVNTILDDGAGGGFIAALKAWVQKGIDLHASQYSNSLQYMARGNEMERKAGRAISADNADKIQAQVKALQDAAIQHKAMMNEHIKALNGIASDLGALLGTPDNFDGSDGKSLHLEPGQPLTTKAEPGNSTPTADTQLADFQTWLRSQINK